MSAHTAFLAVLLAVPPVAVDHGPPPRELDRFGLSLPAGAVARLGMPPVLSGNTADVAWTPDGRRFVAADGTTVATFDAATGRPIETQTNNAAHGPFTALTRD